MSKLAFTTLTIARTFLALDIRITIAMKCKRLEIKRKRNRTKRSPLLSSFKKQKDDFPNMTMGGV